MNSGDSINQGLLQVLLKNGFQSIKSKNRSFSLRAYAKRLGLSPGALSTILRGRRRVSLRKASEIIRNLNLSPQQQKEIKEQLIQAAKIAESQASSHNPAQAELELQEDQFQLISDGIHFALLSLLETQNCQSQIPWLAKRLQTTLKKIGQALDRLQRLNLITKNESDEWIPTHFEVKTTNNISSAAIKNYHEDRLEESKEKLHTIPIELRDFSCVTIAVNSQNLQATKLLIQKFKEDLKNIFQAGPKDQVYRLNLQLYPVTKIDPNQEEK